MVSPCAMESEEVMPWNDRFLTGVPVIDQQHKKLVEIVNELGACSKDEECSALLEMLFQRLMEYTRYHFKTEEDLLRKHHYPWLEEHQSEHQNLREDVETYYRLFKDGQEGMEKDVLVFLRKWLTHHILSEDMKYVPHLREEGTRGRH